MGRTLAQLDQEVGRRAPQGIGSVARELRDVQRLNDATACIGIKGHDRHAVVTHISYSYPHRIIHERNVLPSYRQSCAAGSPLDWERFLEDVNAGTKSAVPGMLAIA